MSPQIKTEHGVSIVLKGIRWTYSHEKDGRVYLTSENVHTTTRNGAEYKFNQISLHWQNFTMLQSAQLFDTLVKLEEIAV